MKSHLVMAERALVLIGDGEVAAVSGLRDARSPKILSTAGSRQPILVEIGPVS